MGMRNTVPINCFQIFDAGFVAIFEILDTTVHNLI